MSNGRAEASREETERAINEVKVYHAKGLNSLEKVPGRGTYGGGAIAAEVDRLNREAGPSGKRWNVALVRKARQFADANLGYDGRRLDELCRLIREHRPSFGATHVGVLVSVTWEGGRAELQRECAERNWSVADLEAAAKLRRAPRPHGGRRRRVGANPGLALIQLAEFADSFRRWIVVAKEKPAGAGEKSAFEMLPRSVKEPLERVNDCLLELQQAVAPALEKARKRARPD